ncbi:SDR family NAD(P)-dependent oxidoreductase [Streptomyces sp. NRRL F-525]|uniref:SDR family NAD(P)-dependent oxidoreductase n=1 Tax=Streptomyces sp. NRRL F-525 TaxID=1463861 RepID=UPI000525B01F|nr:SDR family oxidoreductase [Streptomyces sp. NRRL F-525]
MSDRINERRHEGRTAVITGAAAGIGRAYALRLAAEGAAVAVLDRADGTAVVKEIADAGGRAIAVQADLTDPASVVAAQGEIAEQFGPVDVLVNNAGIYPNQPFDTMTFEDWRAVFTLNVDALFHTAKAFTPGMRERGWGRIVNMTSNSIGLVIPGFAHYVASKMGVIGFTRGLATDLADAGITVNAIAPSLVRTATAEAGPAEFFDAVPQLQAIHRVQVPEDLTGMLSFLVSDDAAFVTGQTLYVDGGLVRS